MPTPVFSFLLAVMPLLLSLRGYWGPHVTGSNGPRAVFEAEEGNYNRLVLALDPSASSGEYLKMGDAGRVAWNVVLDSSGWYDLTFRYRSPQGEKVQALIRNERETEIGFGYAKEWAFQRTQTFLRDGLNIVGLESRWGFIDIDYLCVEPVAVRPSVTPRRNIFYKEAPSDLWAKVERYGHRLVSITCNGRQLPFETSDFPEREDAALIRMRRQFLLDLPAGERVLTFNFDKGPSVASVLGVMETTYPSDLTIIAPDVEHGSAVLFILPTRKIMLVDCGKDWARDSILIPFLDRHGITMIHHFFVTHYHEDHESGDRGTRIRGRYGVERFYDYQSFTSGQSFDLDGARMTILNSYEDGQEENTRSLSFKLEYNGFVYVHGGDTYAENQRKILERFPDHVRADVFYANHHFHGSVDVGYLQAMDPSVVILQAEKAIYARSAYMVGVREQFAFSQTAHFGRFVEILPTLEVGTIVVRVDGQNRWTYETHGNTSRALIPYLF